MGGSPYQHDYVLWFLSHWHIWRAHRTKEANADGKGGGFPDPDPPAWEPLDGPGGQASLPVDAEGLRGEHEE
jgi:hypothetical protein